MYGCRVVVLFFEALVTKALPKKLLGKATLICTPTHPGGLSDRPVDRQTNFCLCDLWSSMRRETGPFRSSRYGVLLGLCSCRDRAGINNGNVRSKQCPVCPLVLLAPMYVKRISVAWREADRHAYDCREGAVTNHSSECHT